MKYVKKLIRSAIPFASFSSILDGAFTHDLGINPDLILPNKKAEIKDDKAVIEGEHKS